MANWRTHDKREAEETVIVNMPDGSRKRYQPLTAEQVNDIALDAGLVNFDVKDGNGKHLHVSDFPINDGEITLSEYNEAKGGTPFDFTS